VARCGLAALAAALIVTSTGALAVETTIGGHPLSLTGDVEIRKGFKVDPETASDQTFEELWLRLRTPLTERLKFDTTFAVRNGGPTTESNRVGFYAFDDVFQSVSPALEFEEAMLIVKLQNADLRIGKQKIAWGKLDRTQPTDLLNTRRYTDPFLRDEDQNKIGVPAVVGTYYLPEAKWAPEQSQVTLAWIPWYQPYRFPRPDERWFPPAAVPPSPFHVPAGTIDINGQPNPAIDVPVGFQARNVDPPAFGLDNSGYAARFSAFSNGVDYSLMYYHGFDVQPAFSLSATVFPDPMTVFRAETELTPAFRKIDAWGGDAAYTWGPFTFRGEATYVDGRPFSRDLRFIIRDPAEVAPQIQQVVDEILVQGAPSAAFALPPSFVVRDAFEWGVGADVTLDGYFLLLQLNQTDVFGNDVELLIRNVESRILATVRKSFWHDDLQLQAQGIYGASSDYTLLLPRATYRVWKGIEAQIGYLFIAGRSSSVVGQYKRNDEGFVRLRYLF